MDSLARIHLFEAERFVEDQAPMTEGVRLGGHAFWSLEHEAACGILHSALTR